MAGNPNPNDLDIHDMWVVALGVDRAVLARKGTSPSNGAAPADQSAKSVFSQMAHGVVANAIQSSKEAIATKEKLKSTLTAIENVKQVGGMYEVTVGGGTRRLTEAEFKGVTSKTRDGMHNRLALLRNRVETVLEGYERQSKIDDDAWVTSHAVKAIGFAKDAAMAVGRAASGKRESRDEDDSGEELARDALRHIESSQKQLDQGRFVIAEDLLGVAENRTKAAERTYSEYHKNVISSAQTAIDAAEFTEKASKYTLAVTAAVATVGASTAVASTAGLIAVAAPVVADVAQAGAKIAYGQKVNWAELGVEIVVSVVVAKFAPGISKGIAERLVGLSPKAASLGLKVVAGIVAGVATGRGAALIQGAANAAVLKYQNEDVTFGTLVGYTIDSVVDPKSTGLDLLLSAIGAAGVSRGTSGPLEGPTPTRSGGQPPPPEDLTFPRGTDVTNASAFPPPKMPRPVSEVELVASNARNPASIKPQEPQAHQQNWQALGGKGTAPPAYRDPEGNVRVSADSPLLQPATRDGISPVRTDQSGSSAPKEVKPVPVAASTSSRQEVGTADTGKAPPAPAPDPLAKTPPAPAPPAAAPAAPGVPPHERTAQAGTASQRAVAQTAGRQIAPPQAISEEAVQRIQNQPRPSPPGRKGRGNGVNYTTDHDAHETAWKRLGGHKDAPPAFIYDDQVYLDPSRWPPKR